LHVAGGTQSVMCAMHLAHDFRVCGNSRSKLSNMIYPSTLHLQTVVTYRVYVVSQSVTYFTAQAYFNLMK